MNRESLVVMRFYRLANISRDLFELILNDGPINMQVFEARGKFFKAVIEDPMIVDFFNRAGENGEKMSKQLKEIYTDTYEQKKFLNVKDDGQYADKSSRVRVLDLAVGTYHSLLDLVKKFVEDAKNKNVLDSDVEELVKREENFFTTVAQFGIFKTILDLNNELQKELQETLMKLGILESLPRNKVNLNITALTSILAAPDEELTKALKQVIPKTTDSSKSSKANAKESKERAMQEALKASIVTTNEELRAAYFAWIEGCFAKDGWMTKNAVITAQQMIDDFSQRNLDVALEVLRIAATNAYRDMQWAIVSYQKNYNVSYQITNSPSVDNSVEEPPQKRPRLSTEVF